MPATVVVTGAAGFVGGHVVERLLAEGDRVVGIDRADVPDHLSGRVGLDWVRADLTTGATAIGSALGDAHAVLHLAGCPGVRDVAPDAGHRRRRDNVDATAAVLAATPPATPLVVTSSSSVYGGYAASKVRAEQLCAQRQARGGVVLVTRPFTVAGERQRPDMALARWIDAARAGRPIRLIGSPDRSRDVTDVRQVAAALVALARCGASGTVNIGTGAAYSLTELADAVCAAVGRTVPRVVEAATPVEPGHTLADTRRLSALLGWAPTTDLPALVARQAAAQSLPAVGQGRRREPVLA